MSEYTLQDCHITVPDAFRDRTMNLFTLSHSAANEFNFVISRATASAEDTLQSVSERLSKELDITLEGFLLFHVHQIQLDGQPAIELFYRFNSGQRVIFQKQRVALTGDIEGKKLLCFIGTSPDAFDDYHGRIYDAITDSITFPADASIKEMPARQIPSDSSSLYFTFDRDNRELALFQGIHSLYEKIDLQRAKNGDYLFFDADGASLILAPITSNNGIERYALWELNGSRKGAIISSLLLARNIRGVKGMDSLEAVEDYISLRVNLE
ncbi:DcrB-related protein [Rosenbergiella epipactidis]|uniref:DcrB-related protein n=1 Tax=Rosenbergiella epipactidis TaxID=1544694 RepID=UPI001F4EE812|nr:DcrB-related protein [Rosenbergiella epipactidis]